jgi:hypothetical protein
LTRYAWQRNVWQMLRHYSQRLSSLAFLPLAVAFVLAAGLTSGCGAEETSPSPKDAASASPIVPGPTNTAPPLTATSAPIATATPRPFNGVPARFRIPLQEIDAKIERLGIGANNTLAAPSDALGAVGWYPDYGAPEAPGYAYFSGFVYFNGEPGPLAKLAQMQPGQTIELVDEHDAKAVYMVQSLTRYTPGTLPFADILQGKGRPENASWITILTGGGRLDSEGDFTDFDVVVAVRVEPGLGENGRTQGYD